MNAQDYKKLARAKRAEMVTHDVTTPSGGVWKMREPPIQQWVLAGKIPASLAGKMASVAKKAGGNLEEANKKALEELSVEDLLNNLAFGRDLLVYCAVQPKISLYADPDSDTEVAPENILPEDFTFLINWVLTGGKSGESLNTFRPE